MPEKTPLIRRFYGKPSSVSAKHRFYAAWDDVEGAYHEVTTLFKAGEHEKARAKQGEYAGELQAYSALKGAHKGLQALRRRKDAVLADETLDRGARNAQLTLIVEREKALIKQALSAYNKAMGKR